MSIALDTLHNQGLPVDVPLTLYTPPSIHKDLHSEPLNDLAIEDLTEDHEPGSTVHVSVSVSLQESLASIARWASQIAPGSPPAPSPRSATFYNPSEDEFKSSQSATFLNLFDSSPSNRAYKNQGQRTPSTPALRPVVPRDLLAQGYTSIFVHLPKFAQNSDLGSPAPDTRFPLGPLPVPRPRPRPSRPRTNSLAAKENNSGQQEKEKPTKLTRFRSLSLKAKKPAPTSPPPPVPDMPPFTKTEINHNTKVSSAPKKSKPKSTPHTRYGALLGPGNGAGALPLAQEVELMRMLDGGSKDHNVRRVAERYARDTNGVNHHSSKGHRSGESNRAHRGTDREREKDHRPVEKRENERDERVGGGVPGVYRDERGALWWDEDEALELTGLLPEERDTIVEPVKPLGPSNIPNTGKAEKRRGLLPRLIMNSNKTPQASGPGADWVQLTSPVVGRETLDGPASSAVNGLSYDPFRRGSAASGEHSSDIDPDLDPSFAIQPRDSSTLTGSPFIPGYSMNVERHMHRREPRGIDAFGRPGISPLDNDSESGTSTLRPRERRERKRPAPLTLDHPLPTPLVPSSVMSSASTVKKIKTPKQEALQVSTLMLNGLVGPTREECEGRKEYFSDQFKPPLSVTPSTKPGSGVDDLTRSSVPKSNVKKSRRESVTLFRRRTSVQGVSSRTTNENENNEIPLMRTSTTTSEATGHGSSGRSRFKGLFKRGA